MTETELMTFLSKLNYRYKLAIYSDRADFVSEFTEPEKLLELRAFDEKGELQVNEKKSKFREQEKKLDKTWAAYRKGHITPKKAMQKRNGIIAYTSKETDSDRIAHLFLKKYQLFEGEYDKYYKGKHNPLGLKNVKKADVQKKISAYAEKEKLIKSYCDDMIVFEELDRGENAERILKESENCFSDYPTAT